MGRQIKSKIKRFASLMLTVVLLVSMVPTALADPYAQFSDFPTDWSKPAMEAAVDNGLLVGIGGGEIGPTKYLTRAEMAAVMVRAFGATSVADVSAFDDLDPDSWYYGSVASAVRMGALSGVSSTRMAPNDYITREQVFSVLARVLALNSSNYDALSKFSDGGDVSDWAQTTVIPMIERGYVNGDGTGRMNPQALITREEFAQLMYATIKQYITAPGTYDGNEFEGITVLRCGNVTLKNVTSNGDLVVGDGAARNSVNLEGVTINGRLLTRGGTNYLKDTTVNYGVVVLNPNGVTAFRNYRTEDPFKGIIEYTMASFLTNTGSSTPSSGTTTTKYTVTFKLFEDDTDKYDEIKVTEGNKIGTKMPDAPDVDDPRIAGYTFNGWVDEDGNEVTEDTRVYGDMLVIADMDEVGDTITVTFYQGYGSHAPTLVDPITLELDDNGEAQIDTEDIPEIVTYWVGYKKSDFMPDTYPDYNGQHDVVPSYWYLDSGVWKLFDENVVLTEDTDVYLLYKQLSLDVKFGTLPNVAITTRYDDNSRLMDSTKSMTKSLVGWLNYAKQPTSPGNPVYEKMTGKIVSILESRNLIDENKNIKMLHIPLPISTALTEALIKDVVEDRIEEIIGDESELAKWPGVSDYLAGSGAVNASAICDAIYDTDAYNDVVDAIMDSEEFDVTAENIELVKAINEELEIITFDTVMSISTNATAQKIVDLIGNAGGEEIFNEGRERYCDDLEATIERVEETSTSETIDSAFDLIFDPIDILAYFYDYGTEKVVGKLEASNVYYDYNPYLQYLVEGHNVIEELFIDTGDENEEITNYRLRTAPEYAEYMMELMIALDDTLCWYGEELTEEQFEELYNAVFAKFYAAHDKIDEYLENFYETGDFPEQIESLLTSVQQLNDIFQRFEPQLRSLVGYYIESGIYDEIVNETLDENSKLQSAVDIMIGKDDPVFTIDVLYDIFYNYEPTMQEKLNELISSGKLDSALDKFKSSSIGQQFGEDAIDDIALIIENVAANGIDYYLVDTSSNPTVIERYELPVGENTITITRSLVF